MAAVFNPSEAKKLLRQRLRSLTLDTKRCFRSIPNLPLAPFPAVLYAFATIDYLSSCWQGWNEQSKKGKRRSQTKRIVGFLVRFCHYGRKESQVAVEVWRHKLMHTGEPRLVNDPKVSRIYGWEIHARGRQHMTLVPVLAATATHKLQLNPFVLVKDLRQAVFGSGAYWDQLQASTNLQARFMRFLRETKSYSLKK